MAKILTVDDDQAFLKLLATILRHHGFQVIQTTNGPDALDKVQAEQPDLIVLDWLMPGMDGLTTCRRLRELTSVPIILLSSLNQEEVIISILKSGANDHMTKPFSVSELVARIDALLNLAKKSSDKTPTVLNANNVSIDVVRRTVEIRGTEIQVTPTEYKILLLLVRNQGSVVPFQTILQEGWGTEYANQLEYLHIYMDHLLRKIESDAEHPTIVERRQDIGYRIKT